MGNFQLLTHATPKLQLLSPPYILLFFGRSPHQLVSQSWVEVSEGWDTMEQVEGRVGKEPGDGEICFYFPLAQPLLHRGRSQQGKGRKHGQSHSSSSQRPWALICWHTPAAPASSACISPSAS